MAAPPRPHLRLPAASMLSERGRASLWPARGPTTGIPYEQRDRRRWPVSLPGAPMVKFVLAAGAATRYR
jgi:hypothetical protein